MKFSATIDVEQYRGKARDNPYADPQVEMKFGNDEVAVLLENVPADRTEEITELRDKLVWQTRQLTTLGDQVDNLQMTLDKREEDLRNCRSAISFLLKSSNDVDTLIRDLLIDQIGINWKDLPIFCIRFLRTLNPNLSFATAQTNLSRYQMIGEVNASPKIDLNEFDGICWRCHGCGGFHLTEEKWKQQASIEGDLSNAEPNITDLAADGATFVQAADATNSASFHADGDIVE